MVRAILGCLLMVAGALVGAKEFLFSDTDFWLPAVLIAASLVILLRNVTHAVDVHDDDPNCRTCRGAGTVYSAEYNDWRATGPVRTVRELCPSCEGLTS